MIEEIKDKTWYRDNNDGKFYNCCKVGDNRTPIIKIDDLFEILDNQPDYKLAWEEIFEKSHYTSITMEDMIEFSKKYNLGGE